MTNVYLLSDTVTGPYESLIVLSIFILFGLLFGKLVEKIKIPYITGYIFSGLLMGGLLVLLNIHHLIADLEIISSIALGFIAFGIGRELIFDKNKKSGVEIIVLTIVQALFTTFAVSVGLILFGVSVPVALIFGAIATATEPASIMLLTKKYRTKGPLTNTLIPLVGFDDAVGIIIFGVLLSIAKSLEKGVSLNFLNAIKEPVIELFFSLLVGVVVGELVTLITKKINSKGEEKSDMFLDVSIFGVFLTVAIAKIGLNFGDFTVHLSPILTPMIFGVTIANSVSKVDVYDIGLAVDKFIPPILIAFFTIAGAELIIAFLNQPNIVLSTLLVVVIGYVGLRTFGKVFGAYLGARIMKSSPPIRKYLGISLLPQAGVALGMAYQARTDFASEGVTILIVVLIATVFYALVGPMGVKYALYKSGETNI